MGKKDYGRKERKKAKKDVGKAATLGPVTPTPQVEVVQKRKAAKEPTE